MIIYNMGKTTQIVMNKELETGSYVLKLNAQAMPPGLYSVLKNYTNDSVRLAILKKMIIY